MVDGLDCTKRNATGIHLVVVAVNAGESAFFRKRHRGRQEMLKVAQRADSRRLDCLEHDGTLASMIVSPKSNVHSKALSSCHVFKPSVSRSATLSIPSSSITGRLLGMRYRAAEFR